MPEQLFPWMHLIGRILFSMIFIASGVNHFFKLNEGAAYATAKGVPAAKLMTVVSGAVILLGGVSVLLGWHRFIGAGLIVIFLLSTAFVMHAFWKETDPMMMQNEMAHFMKDMALAGAALLIAFYSGMPWPMSIGG